MDYLQELGEDRVEKIAWDMVRAIVKRLDFKAIIQETKERNPDISEEIWREMIGEENDWPDVANDELFDAYMAEHNIDVHGLFQEKFALVSDSKEE